MTRDDIIRMAQEAGISTGGHPMNPWNVYPSDLERFANLVAAAEREACARVCEDGIVTHKGARILHGVDCAKLIRARGDET